MRYLKTLIWCLIAIIVQSCYKPGKIQVQNNISQVVIEDVRWGKINVSSQLYPGETSDKMEVRKNAETLPSSYPITFKMRANNKTIFLQTNQTYMLEEEEVLVIELTDNTPVSNPN